MEDKDRASAESPTSPFESRLTREELLKRSAVAAVAVGTGGSLAGVAKAATRSRRCRRVQRKIHDQSNGPARAFLRNPSRS